MENKNIKKSANGVGRPKYQPNIKQLKKLYKEIEQGKITNERRMANGTVVVRHYGIE